MVHSSHRSAKPSHYNNEAENYDTFNEDNSKSINRTIEKILKRYKVRTVLDLTCGTGSQVFWLAKQGYKIVGVDINSEMLKIARSKTKKDKNTIEFIKGDMRTVKMGNFDAVITIFNAVGHLTKTDFEKTMRNIHENLNKSGLYVFDIFNLNYLMNHDNITKLTIDWLKTVDNTQIRDIQFSVIEEGGVLASYTTSYVQKDLGKRKIYKYLQTLQVYTATQLREMLTKNGFKVLTQCGIDGSRFSNTKTERIVTIAQKQ